MKNKILFNLILFFFILSITASGLSYYAVYHSELAIKNNGMIKLLAGKVQKAMYFFYEIPFYTYKFQNDGLSLYKIYIDKKYLVKLNNKLPKNSDEILNMDSKDAEPAIFFDENGNKYETKLRYRGDHASHWINFKKSLRLNFVNPNYLNGMEKINLITGSRGLLEYFNNYRAKKLGLAVPFDNFVKVKINDIDYGIYYLVEQWGEGFLKRNNINSKSYLYGELGVSDPIYESAKYWQDYINKYDEGQENYQKLDELLKLISFAGDEEFKNKIFTIIDKENFFNWWVHSLLMGSNHQDFYHNIRLYFDKDEDKFKFIPVDVFSGFITEDLPMDFYYNPLIDRILQFSELVQYRNQVLWSYVSNMDNLIDDLNFYDQTWENTKIAFFNDDFKSYTSKDIILSYELTRNQIIDNFKNLKKQLSQSKIDIEINKNVSAELNKLFYRNIPFVLTFNNFNYSAIELYSIDMSSLAKDNKMDWLIYEDTNSDKILNAGDLLLNRVKYNYRTNSYLPIDLNKKVYSKLITPNEKFNFYQITNSELMLFFVDSLGFIKIDNLDLSFKLTNMVTGEISVTNIK